MLPCLRGHSEFLEDVHVFDILTVRKTCTHMLNLQHAALFAFWGEMFLSLLPLAAKKIVCFLIVSMPRIHCKRHQSTMFLQQCFPVCACFEIFVILNFKKINHKQVLIFDQNTNNIYILGVFLANRGGLEYRYSSNEYKCS